MERARLMPNLNFTWQVTFGQLIGALLTIGGIVWGGLKLATKNVVRQSAQEMLAEFKGATISEIHLVAEDLKRHVGDTRAQFDWYNREIRELREDQRRAEKELREEIRHLAGHIQNAATIDVIRSTREITGIE